MAAYKKVLIALDLTNEMTQVIGRYEALGLSESEGYLIHVVKPIEYTYGSYSGIDLVPNSATFEHDAVIAAQRELASLGMRLNIPPERQHVVLGRPATEIRDFAKVNDIDLILIGTHGQHGLGLLLGSTANAVLHGTPCDVVVVRIQPK